MASTYLTRTPSSAGNRKTWTWSSWIKTATTSGDKGIFSASTDSSNRNAINLSNEGYFIFDYEVGGTRNILSSQNATYRDISGWYHLVVAVDTTQATDTDRVKIYVNGSQITLTGVINDYPSQNDDMFVNNTVSHSIGRQDWGTSYFDGSMSHIHFIDGTAYDASAFGETDTTTGEWKAKTSPSVTYGTNGFFILKDGNGITDQSGEGNDFTLGGGTLTNLKDNPDNVFATMNPIDSYWMAATYSNGNNKVVTQGSHMTSMAATLGASSGKYYWEVKVDDVTGQLVIGIDTKGASTCSNFSSGQCLEYTGERAYAWSYRSNSGVVLNNDSSVSYGNTYTTGDIIGVALDLDNNKIYWSKNGTWQNSGVPTSGSTGTGAVSITAPSSTDTGVYFPACSDVSSSASSGFSMNFGNGYFGTTAVSSAGTNASDNGIFEYDVPTGYTALSTKGLNL